MSSTLTTQRTTEHSPAQATLTGTGRLLRTMIRRDRVRTTAWVVGLGLLGFYFAHAIQVIAEDTSELVSLTVMFADPVGRMMVGPGYGMDAPTHERFFAAGYVLFLYLLCALMSIFTVVRHTRADEQAGRSDLVRATVVGRHAPLTAALILTVLANLAVGVLVFGGAVSAGYAFTGSMLVAAGGVATGVFFGGLGAVTAQLASSSRSASGFAGAVLGLAYVVRMAGDMAAPGGSSLSWFSPLAWAQQTAPYVVDRAWPLLPLVGGGVLLAACGFVLSTRRDVGSGILPTRLGRSSAHSFLGTPWGMAYRTLRGGLRGWGIALVLTAAMYGSFTQTMVDAGDDLPAEFSQIFAGQDMIAGYVAYMSLFLAVFVAAAGVNAMGHLRGEELSGRAELGVSTSMGRGMWLVAHLCVIVAGVFSMLVMIGLVMAATAVATMATPVDGLFTDAMVASVHQFPAVLAVLGVVAAFFGWLPRFAMPIGWLLVGCAGALSAFGPLLELPDAVLSLNVFGHLAGFPVEDITGTPVVALTAVGTLGIVLGLAGWRQRDIHNV
ncbi:ABC transporter permease [Jonesia quinghaiensis]|uniref:ABC transporter permease n=1 Tax=Jonesia quinghaiensis TaxID=262806 RepID=UPI00040A98CF|nr:hypothetical protein [Jonesia quinghaiensis]